MRKTLCKGAALVLSLLLVLNLCGCAQESEPQAAKEPQPQQTQQTAAPDESDPSASGDANAVKISCQPVDPGYSDRELEGTYDKEDVSATAELSDGGISVSGGGAAAEGSVLTVSDEGVYVLSGSLSNGSVVVDAEDSDKVQIVLAGVNITCADGPAIHIKSADKVFLTIWEGTENVLSDGAEYVLEEGEDEPNACVFSKADLTINGSGGLTVAGNYRHGVNSKDDLIITGGQIGVTAMEDGLRGKDGVGIADGVITVEAGEDGVHSSGDEEDLTRGWISIDGGALSVTSGNDGVQAATVLQLRGGEVNLVTGGGAANAPAEEAKDNFGFGGMGGGFGGWFGQDRNEGAMPEMPSDGTIPELPEGMEIPEGGWKPGDGTIPELPEGMEMPEGGWNPGDGTMPEFPEEMEMPEGGWKPGDGTIPERPEGGMMPGGVMPELPGNEVPAEAAAGEETAEESVSDSCKGLKSDGGVLILGGVVKADCADDTVHGVEVQVSGGEMALKTGDDGLHADGAMLIDGGKITIEQSVEGIEGKTVDIADGKIDVTSSDDGINAAGESTGNEMMAQEGVYIAVSGGSIHVDAGGDGLDSNGELFVSGGTLIVDGSLNGGNGALDYASKGEITGGYVAAMGAQQMAMNFGSTSTQCSTMVNFATVSAGAQMALLDENGVQLMTWVSAKQTPSAVISCPEMKEGATYTLTADGQTLTTFEASIPTGSGGMMGGFGGGRGGRGDMGGMQRPNKENRQEDGAQPGKTA